MGGIKKIIELSALYEDAGNSYLQHDIFGKYQDANMRVLGYSSAKGNRHHSYKHYASGRRIQQIIDGNALFLTDGSSWNDLVDRRRFNEPFMAKKNFGVCFSYAGEESVAMWMLYGGFDSNGAMIDFDQRKMKSICDYPEYECGYFGDEGFVSVRSLSRNECKVSLIDVLYFGSQESDGYCNLRHPSDVGAARVPFEAVGALGHITKHASWSYEKEVRLVASIDRLSLGADFDRVACVKVPLALDNEYVRERVYDSPVASAPLGYRKSILSGTVDWDLCKGCDHREASRRP